MNTIHRIALVIAIALFSFSFAGSYDDRAGAEEASKGLFPVSECINTTAGIRACTSPFEDGDQIADHVVKIQDAGGEVIDFLVVPVGKRTLYVVVYNLPL